MKGAESRVNHQPFRVLSPREMTAQTHWHTDVSDAFTSPEMSVEHAFGSVNILVITDHDKTIGAVRALDHATRQGYINLSYQADSHFEVVIGQEITTADGHILGEYLESTIVCGMSAEETALAIREQGGLVVVPHPSSARASGISLETLDDLESKGLIDAVETINGGQESLALLRTVPVIGRLKRYVGDENTNAAMQKRYNLNGVSYAAVGGHDGHSNERKSMTRVVTVFEEGIEYRTAIQHRLTAPRSKSDPEIWGPKKLISQNLKSRRLERQRRRGDGIICVKGFYE